jgi:hypothetical protein
LTSRRLCERVTAASPLDPATLSSGHAVMAGRATIPGRTDVSAGTEPLAALAPLNCLPERKAAGGTETES